MKMFTMSVTIDGQEFTGKASCKKLAKAEAAKQALIQLYNFKVPPRKYFLIFICQVRRINEPVHIKTKKMICVRVCTAQQRLRSAWAPAQAHRSR